MLNMLKDLLNIESFSGNEKPVREYIIPILKECKFNNIIDDMGNILATRGKSNNYPMLNAHMDSVKGYSTSRTYNYKALYEQVNENKKASKIKETECSKCPHAQWWTPSEYYCKKCDVFDKIKKALKEEEKEEATSEKSCRNCVYFTECIPLGYHDAFMQLSSDTTCNAYEPVATKKKEKKKEFKLTYDKKKMKLTSNEIRPMGGDDKCGIAIALQIAKETDIPMKILFTVQEETGCNGVRNVAKKNLKFLSDVMYSITIDRKYGNELLISSANVRNCSNLFAGELAKWGIIAGIPIKLENGGLADVCVLRDCNMEAVNISAGYYEPHRNSEFVKFDEVLSIKEWVKNFMLYSLYGSDMDE